MYLVLVFVVPMVSRPRADVGQCLLLGVDETHKLVATHEPIVIIVYHPQDQFDDSVPPLGRDVLVGLVHQTICPEDLLRLPVPVGIEVVQCEERSGIESIGVVFFWKGVQTLARDKTMLSQAIWLGPWNGGGHGSRTRHVFLHPIGIWADYRLLRPSAVVSVGEGMSGQGREKEAC